jgi:hypothetical protein
VLRTGLAIESLIECDVDTAAVKDCHLSPEYWYSYERAKLLPTTMIIKARKMAG